MTVETIVGAPPTRYAGLATRAVGLAVDVAIAQAIVFAGGAVIALVFSLVGGMNIDTTFEKLLAAAAWGLVVGFYFVLFWSTAGQTPGMRLMALRVMNEAGGHPNVWWSTVRLIALGLCIIPLCAGFIPVLFDDRRRGVHDMIARTTVVYVQE